MSPFKTPFAALLGLTSGWLVWASCFVALYAVLSLGCENGWQYRPFLGWHVLGFALAGTWFLHLAVQAGLLTAFVLARRPVDHRAPEHTQDLRRWLMPLSTLLWAVSLLATVWTGWPVLALPACA